MLSREGGGWKRLVRDMDKEIDDYGLYLGFLCFILIDVEIPGAITSGEEPDGAGFLD